MRTKEENFERAEITASMIIQATSVAVLLLKDYECIMNQLGYQTKQITKKMVTVNAEKAAILMTNLMRIEKNMIKTITVNDKDNEDHFLNDVGFMYNLILSSYEMCYDSEQRRESILKKINTAYKTKLKEIR